MQRPPFFSEVLGDPGLRFCDGALARRRYCGRCLRLGFDHPALPLWFLRAVIEAEAEAVGGYDVVLVGGGWRLSIEAAAAATVPGDLVVDFRDRRCLEGDGPWL